MNKKHNITPYTVISRNQDVAWRILGGNLIAITPADNKVHRLNQTGTFIWQCLENSAQTVDGLRQKVEHRFDMQGGKAERDIRGFITEIHAKGLLNIES